MEERLAHRRASRRGERLARKRLAKKFGTIAKKLNGPENRLSGRLVRNHDRTIWT